MIPLLFTHCTTTTYINQCGKRYKFIIFDTFLTTKCCKVRKLSVKCTKRVVFKANTQSVLGDLLLSERGAFASMVSLNNIRVTKIFHTFTPRFEKHEVLHFENRQYFGISLAIDGEATYYADGKKYVSDSEHIIIFPKGKTYSLKCTKTGSFTLINFDCVGFECNEFMRIKISDVKSFISDHKMLENLDYFNKPYNRAKYFSIFYGMLARVAKDDPQNPFPMLRPIVRIMREMISDPNLSNEDLAKEAQLSEVYFRKLFKLCYGISPKQYLQQLRIEKAKEILQNSSHSITKIAEKCGYSSVYHFSKIFKEKVGYNPAEYRKIYRNFYF